MTNEEILKAVQKAADETAQKFPFKRNAQLTLIYTEELGGGSVEAYVLGSDMPLLIYRIFDVDEQGNAVEVTDIQKVVERSRHYTVDVKPNQDMVVQAVNEMAEYEIVLENRLPDNAVELILKSSVGREVTMIETYRYFDYVSRIFFVSCIAVSFGGQYLFSVTPDGKHVRMIIGNDENIKARVDMITELLKNRVLPSYRTINDGTSALANPDAHAKVTFNTKDGGQVSYLSNFCYDDLESDNMFAFFVNEKDNKQGLMFIQDIITGQLTLRNSWNNQQQEAANKVLELMKSNPDEFNKHAHSFFADSLDLRYKACIEGRLTAENAEGGKKE